MKKDFNIVYQDLVSQIKEIDETCISKGFNFTRKSKLLTKFLKLQILINKYGIVPSDKDNVIFELVLSHLKSHA